ncbi:P-loop containing nucleoside triphosphate hydrolase protein [Tilletiaria anomala UBC 951]|uniref:p-loop containing nucleoside triphosphate hydrolase protein n=1 Tax=Tilletiaria anomala (strain ATCC 24038 / CBS 436.72 / UBC 951) TaxID=1037660 RepID=A0A066WFS3_TILAU|nr:P-loop containing nucleoside triphosphate hydrolase protein [Tilletiaria anomala UBC 951]KDN51338.1 P-loop containing nucleoside triphosphate hydrolase protein [Tilletiaria anomala UBC 951]
MTLQLRSGCGACEHVGYVAQRRVLNHLAAWRAPSYLRLRLPSSVELSAKQYEPRRDVQTDAAPRPPLFELRASGSTARVSHCISSSSGHVSPKTSHLPAPLKEPWIVHDAGESECWAIIGPAIEAGGETKAALIRFLLGRHSPTQHPHLTTSHPFLSTSNRSASQAMQHVTFSTRIASCTSAGAGAGNFVDFSARYGAIRTVDKVTLYESLLEQLGVFTGNIAAMKLLPDPLAPGAEADTKVEGIEGADAAELGRFKWSSEQARRKGIAAAQHADAVVRSSAKLLNLDGELLHCPLIALSNGQTRRARILATLLAGGECIIMEEPYTGLDPPTRAKVSKLLAELHAKRAPRVIMVLREQDSLPNFVTHVLRIDDAGEVVSMGRLSGSSERDSSSSVSGVHAAFGANAPGGYDVVVANAKRGIGQGDMQAAAVVELSGVTIAYKGKKVLSDVSMRIAPGSRTVLVGDNGSGKTTLLSLLLGDHPLSYALPAEQLRLFGAARRDRSNSTVHLHAKVGHFSPELFNAFPRRPLELAGLSVGEAVASGFENIFTRRSYSGEQMSRVHALLAHFADLLRINAKSSVASSSAGGTSGNADNVALLATQPFMNLTAGSQAVVLFLRALVHAPQLLILDEPFQGMDRRQVQRVRRFIDSAGSTQDGWEGDVFVTGSNEQGREADRKARQGMAVVVVSHYEEEWPSTCGKLLRLQEGVVSESI